MTELRAAPDGAHPLPDGGWVVLRDPSSIKQRDRKALVRSIDASRSAGDGEMVTALSSVDATIALAVTEWSYEAAVPSQNTDVLDDLDIPVYDAIAEMVRDFTACLFPDTADAGDGEDKSTPTGPSSA